MLNTGGDQVSPSNPKSPKIHKLKPLICSKPSFKHELVIISLWGSKGDYLTRNKLGGSLMRERVKRIKKERKKHSSDTRKSLVSPSNPKSPKIHKLKPLICSKPSFKHELVIISLWGSKV
uniref:Uncharacterized protein n=1 Tax=Helianthus annuus TaxID=4232 RepID=A0A251S704_HELAN